MTYEEALIGDKILKYYPYDFYEKSTKIYKEICKFIKDKKYDISISKSNFYFFKNFIVMHNKNSGINIIICELYNILEPNDFTNKNLYEKREAEWEKNQLKIVNKKSTGVKIL